MMELHIMVMELQCGDGVTQYGDGVTRFVSIQVMDVTSVFLCVVMELQHSLPTW